MDLPQVKDCYEELGVKFADAAREVGPMFLKLAHGSLGPDFTSVLAESLRERTTREAGAQLVRGRKDLIGHRWQVVREERKDSKAKAPLRSVASTAPWWAKTVRRLPPEREQQMLKRLEVVKARISALQQRPPPV